MNEGMLIIASRKSKSSCILPERIHHQILPTKLPRHPFEKQDIVLPSKTPEMKKRRLHATVKDRHRKYAGQWIHYR